MGTSPIAVGVGNNAEAPANLITAAQGIAPPAQNQPPCAHQAEFVVCDQTIEDLFRTAKALLRTRPIYHSADAAIRGHVFCSFLALVLKKELEDRCHAAGLQPEWGDVLRDLDRLQEVELLKDGKRLVLRTPVSGVAGKLFQAARIALPPNIREPAPTT